MTILEASGKQEPETKEAPAGPLEEVRACSPFPKPERPRPLLPSPAISLPRLLLKGTGGGETAAPYSLYPVCRLP